MDTSTLRAPDKGRSRFSKALPAPPPSLDSSMNKNNTMVLPRRKESLGLPTLPPKEITTTMLAKPLDSPLPPVPLKTGAPPVTMSIPRRPVASPPAVSPPPPAEPSPVGSISSLLSAYSRGSSDSILRSSDGTASTKDSYLEISPKKEDSINNGLKKIDYLPPLSFSFSDHEVQEKTSQKPQDGPKKAVEKLETLMADLDLPPPPPLKDPQVPRTPTSAPQSPFSATSSFAAPLAAANQSPPRSQLLRRRSLKKDKPLPLTELKLTSSHGSTADSPSQVQNVQQQPPAPEILPSLAPPQPSSVSNTAVSPLSRGYTAFPGRNIKPQTSKTPSPQPPAMGESASKIEGKIDETFKRRPLSDKAIEGGIDAKGNIVKQVESGQEPTFRRLPTPEYQKSDVKTPITETIVSPVSPVSLTGSPEGFKAPVSNTGSTGASFGGSDVASVRSDATLRPPRGPLPTIPGSPREPGVSPATQTSSIEKLSFPVRSASKQPVGTAKGLPRTPAPLNKQRAPTPSSRPESSSSDTIPAVVPKTGGSVREGPPVKLSLDTSSATVSSFDNAVQAAGEHVGEPLTPSHPAYFPKTLLSTSKEVAFRHAVRESHLRCFTSHATLVSDPNRAGMGKCQVCSKDDNSPRKSCGHCFLHLCEPCSQVLTDMKGNLKQLMEVVNNQGIKGRDVAAPESTTGSATSDRTIRPTRA